MGGSLTSSRAQCGDTHGFTVAYDERLALRVRRVLADRRDVEEKAIFGGLAFMARGHMCCGLVQARLMVRVDPQAYDQLLQEPPVQPMDFTGRPMRGFLYVEPDGIASAPALRKWIGRVLAFAERLTPKAPRKSRVRTPTQSDKRAQPAAVRRKARKQEPAAAGLRLPLQP